MTKHITPVILLSLVFPALLNASFIRQPGGGRPSAMGGAYTAIADTGDGLFYNPAGIARLKSTEISIMASQVNIEVLKEDKSLSDAYGLLCIPALDKSTNETKGIMGIAFTASNFQDYYQKNSIGMYYSVPVRQWLLAGIGLKYANTSYDKDRYLVLNSNPPENASVSFAAVDAGVMLLPAERISVGAAVRDLHQEEKDVLYRDDLSQTVAAGCAYRGDSILLAVDAVSYKSDYEITAGAERSFLSGKLPVRIGAGTGNNDYGMVSAGSGYNGKGFFADFSFNYPVSGTLKDKAAVKVSSGLRFGSAPKNTPKPKEKAEKPIENTPVKKEMQEEPEDPVYKNSQDAKLLINIAISAIKDGEYMKAMDVIRQALELAPQEQRYIYMRTKLEFLTTYVFFSVGNTGVDKAIRKAVVKYVVDDEIKDAVEMFQYAYSLKPGNESLFKLIKALAKEYDITIDNSARTWNLAEQKVYQALDKFRQKKFDECIKLCEEALDLEPTNVTAYKRLGSTFYLLGNIERAKDNWRKVIELAPNDEDTQQIRQLLNKIEREEKGRNR